MDYKKYRPVPAKFMTPDGSITDKLTTTSGDPEAIDPAEMSKAYKKQAPVPAKFLLPDGTITDKLPVDSEGTSIMWDDIQGKPSTFPPSTHNHNDLYYLKSEIDSPNFMDGRVSWEHIVARPQSSTAQIDNAVTNSHTHANKSVLDRLGIDEQGRLTIDGVPYPPTE